MTYNVISLRGALYCILIICISFTYIITHLTVVIRAGIQSGQVYDLP